MKNLFLTLIFTLLISTSVLARSTGCKEGNCENGYGKWIYTDKTTYEGEWVATKKHGQGTETWPFNPLTTFGRTRNTKITLDLGVPDERNEWQFSLIDAGEPAVFHMRTDYEIYYYTNEI